MKQQVTKADTTAAGDAGHLVDPGVLARLGHVQPAALQVHELVHAVGVADLGRGRSIHGAGVLP